MSIYASGNANVTISTSATSNGSWSTLTSGTYTFTPSANSANVLNTEIQNRLLGSGLTAGDVTIVTACSGTGSQNGNVTTSTTITAATTGTKTLTITAGGSISISNTINLTGTTGQPGGRISFSAASSITLNALITTSGTSPSAGSGATGGAAGSITLNSSANDIFVYAGLTAAGAPGGTSGTASGGAGGAITITGNAITISTGGTIDTQGGTGPGANGGVGGAVSITASIGKITISRNITTTGGNAGSANTGQSGGTGGAITLNARTNLSVSSALTSTGGSNGGYYYQCGGSGGNVTLYGTTVSTSTITTAKGTNGGGAACSTSNGSSSSNINPLPVELIDFNAKLINDYVLLSWQTLSEINNDYFILERLDDVGDWKQIAKISSAGNSTIFLNYEWNDDADFNGKRYYRLIQVDFDGSQEKFKIIEVSKAFDRTVELNVFPNPIQNEVNISFTTYIAEECRFSIYSEIGQELYNSSFISKEGNNNFTFNTSNFAQGVYFFSFEMPNGITAHTKVVK